MGDADYKIPKLNGDNYHSWAIRARACMVQKRCWEAIEPGFGVNMADAERRKNDEALTLMFLIVEDTFLDDIGDCVRAVEAWDALKKMHTKFGLLHILQLMKDFFNVTMKPGEAVQSYLGRLMDIHRKLSTSGYSFTDREVALVMLIGLPKAYEPLILNLEKDEENMTTTLVKSSLIIEEKRIHRKDTSQEFSEEKALHTKNFQPKKPLKKWQKIKSFQGAEDDGSQGRNKEWHPKKNYQGAEDEGFQRRNTRCFSCGEWGHISKNCVEAQQRVQNMAKTAVDLRNLALSATCGNYKSHWILDSGATEHMTSDRERFDSLQQYTSTVEVANSEKIAVTGKGEILLAPRDNANGRNFTMSDVLYVPNLGGSLLSIGRIEERGFRVQFAEGEAKIINKDGETVLTAKRRGRLYMIEESQPTAYLTKAENEELWHRRLGHPHKTGVKSFDSSVDNQKTNPSTNSPCSVCIQGKMKKRSFPKASSTRAEQVLEIIHSDVVGKISPPSLGGSNYFVVFTDDFSHYTTVYTIKTKDEVLSKFDEFRRMAENLHNRKIKTLRSDNGGEYRSKEFDEYLIRHGIQRQLTVPESPQQNGVSERMNQSLINSTRCLLIESGLEASFWAEAVSTAAKLRNKCPSAAIEGDIPERRWTGKEVLLDHLKVFGCRAWSHERSFSRKSKLDPKAKECVFVGYPDGTKGYKLWDPKKKTFLISRDIIFEENVFPSKLVPVPHKQPLEISIKFNLFEESVEDYEQNSETFSHSHEPVEEIEPNSEICEQPREQHLSHLPEDPQNDENEDGYIDQHDEEAVGPDSDLEAVEQDSFDEPVTPEVNNQTSRTRIIKPPQHLNDYVLYKAECPLETKETEKDPTSVKEALASPEAMMWKRSMDEEMQNLQRAQTWELVPKPANIKPIGCKWVFKKKVNAGGEVTKYKSRLVAKGYSQVPGRDFTETFSPVIKLKSIRLLLALAVELDFRIHQMDITAAYLNGTLNEDIFMFQPEGCKEEGKEHLVCHLKRSLYGLKQSGREWNKCFDTFLKDFGLLRSKSDPCIYYHPDKTLYVGIYVDDMLVVGFQDSIDTFKHQVMQRFQARDLGEAEEILSMRICRKPDGSITLDQTGYIEEVLETFEASSIKGASTPLDPGTKHYKVEDAEWNAIKEESEKIPYRQAIGSLLYLACGTRPDIAHSATYMSQFNERPSELHWRSVRHLLRYLKETKNLCLNFSKTGKVLEVFSDSDWGFDRVDRKSFSGYVFILGGAAVSWSSKKQYCTALSSAEAEYIAIAHAMKEVLWFKGLLLELGIQEFIPQPITVRVDNQAAIFIASNQTTSERSKHIDIRYHFVRDYIEQKVVKLEYVSSKDNVADLFTKNISKKVLFILRKHLGLNV